MTQRMARTVVVLRLSGLTPEAAAQQAQDLVNDRSVPDLSSLLVVDDTLALREHDRAYERLLNSGRVPHLVCLAVGPPGRPGQILVPGNIGAGRGSAVLWASDRLGVDWALGTSTVALVRPEDGPDGVERLIEVLSSVAVYERVRELSAKVPHGIACPGLRLAETGGAAEEFPAALAEAIHALLDPVPGQPADHGQPYSEILQAAPAGGRLTESGTLAQARNHCVATAEDAVAALNDLARPGGLLIPSRDVRAASERLADAGHSLAELRDLVSRTLDDLPADGTVSERQRERLRQAGISLRPGSDVAAPSARRPWEPEPTLSDAVSAAVSGSLRGDATLPVVTGRIAATEALLRRPAGAAHRSRVDQACPPSLPARLLQPPPFPTAPRWLPVAGTVAVAVAGAAGVVTGAIAAVAWFGLAVLAARRTGGPAASDRAPLAVNAVAAAAGAVVGWVLSTSLQPPMPVAAAGIVLALALAATAVIRSWQARATAWQAAVRAPDASTAAWALTALVESAVGEFRAADESLLEAVARARIVVDAISARLRGEMGDRPPPPGRPSGLAHIVAPALRDLAVVVLTGQIADFAGDGQSEHDKALGATGDLLAAWAEHVAGYGPLAPPPFARPDAYEGPAHSAQGWHDAIRAAIDPGPRAVMWQLCTPGDLPMLDVGGVLPTVPFAPQITQTGLAAALPSNTNWTVSGHCAGLLRLVPIRLAAVTTSWAVNDGQEPL